MFLAGLRQVVKAVSSSSFHCPRSRQEFLPFVVWSECQVRRRVVGHVLHGLEPVVRVAELGHNQGVVWVSVVGRVLEPVLVTSQLSSNFNRVIEAITQMSVVFQGTKSSK